jgi:shikimate dehydrogenase
VHEIAEQSDIIINSTSAGMYPAVESVPLKEEDIPSGKIIMDIVYTPRLTKFIMLSKKKKNIIITGDRMLLYQATIQYKLWTGKGPDERLFEKELMKQLR